MWNVWPYKHPLYHFNPFGWKSFPNLPYTFISFYYNNKYLLYKVWQLSAIMRRSYFIQESLMKKKMHTGVSAYGLCKDVQSGGCLSLLKHHLLREGRRLCDPQCSEQCLVTADSWHEWYLLNEFMNVFLHKHVAPHSLHPGPFLAPAQPRIRKETKSSELNMCLKPYFEESSHALSQNLFRLSQIIHKVCFSSLRATELMSWHPNSPKTRNSMGKWGCCGETPQRPCPSNRRAQNHSAGHSVPGLTALQPPSPQSANIMLTLAISRRWNPVSSAVSIKAYGISVFSCSSKWLPTLSVPHTLAYGLTLNYFEDERGMHLCRLQWFRMIWKTQLWLLVLSCPLHPPHQLFNSLPPTLTPQWGGFWCARSRSAFATTINWP